MPITTLAQAETHVRAKNRPGQIDGILLAEIDRLRANEAAWMQRVSVLIAHIERIGAGPLVQQSDTIAAILAHYRNPTEMTPPQKRIADAMKLMTEAEKTSARHRAAAAR